MNNSKLEQIEMKLFICTDILTNKGQYLRLIETVIEEDITHWWLTYGGRKRSDEIHLKTRKLVGSEAALDTSTEIMM